MNTPSLRGVARQAILATAVLTVGCMALLTSACGNDRAPVKPSSSRPSSLPPASPRSAPPSSPPVAGSIAGLAGWLYYADADRLVRLTASGATTVLSAGAYGATVSPDGTGIAFTDQSGNVVVAARDGQHRRTVLHGAIGVGYEPAWSPDAQRLLVAKAAAGGDPIFGVVTIASGSFTPLAHQLQDAIHPLWSADGHHLGYATGTCGLGTADADGGNAHAVPSFGDRNSAANPQRRRSCDPYSISPDGGLIAVNQRTGNQEDGDIGRDLVANTVIDTRTGANVTLPVTGSITAILFLPTGDILVRGTDHGAIQLTLLNPNRMVKARVAEPASVKDFSLLAYTPG